MKTKVIFKLFVLFISLSFLNISSAALTDTGNGDIYDSTLDIFWMKDANLVKTSCDSNNQLWQAFDPSTLPIGEQSGNTKGQICSNDGSMNWHEAELWISTLNNQNYLGSNNWRQPITTQPDVTCEDQIPATGGFPANGRGYNCSLSELGNLFNISLANPNGGGSGSTGGTVGTNCLSSLPAPYCFQNTGPFTNTMDVTHPPIILGYLSGTEHDSLPSFNWVFNTSYGFQNRGPKVNIGGAVWPVRSNIIAPNNVPSLSFWSIILLISMLFLISTNLREKLIVAINIKNK